MSEEMVADNVQAKRPECPICSEHLPPMFCMDCGVKETTPHDLTCPNRPGHLHHWVVYQEPEGKR